MAVKGLKETKQNDFSHSNQSQNPSGGGGLEKKSGVRVQPFPLLEGCSGGLEQDEPSSQHSTLAARPIPSVQVTFFKNKTQITNPATSVRTQIQVPVAGEVGKTE